MIKATFSRLSTQLRSNHFLVGFLLVSILDDNYKPGIQ